MRLEFVLGFASVTLGTTWPAQTMGPARQTPAPAENQRAVLVELFTSEGCSSCPPADDLLRKIDGKHTNTGVLIVGVSEHVNYWDHDGWKDPFDSSTITDRQDEYGKRFQLGSVYTPQMVVNGETQISGNDPKALLQAIQKTAIELGATVKITSAKIDGNAVIAVVSFAGAPPKHGADVVAVVAQDETTPNVAGGENKGRALINASVARTLVKAARIRNVGETILRIPLPDNFATSPDSRRHLIVWVQEPNEGPVLGLDTVAF